MRLLEETGRLTPEIARTMQCCPCVHGKQERRRKGKWPCLMMPRKSDESTKRIVMMDAVDVTCLTRRDALMLAR